MLVNYIKTHLRVFFFILLLSLPFSLLLFIGRIDQDFFAYYYIGRGINMGMDMFKDFADNKGPVNHLFYALLYWLFRDNYRLALFSANMVVDSIAIFYLVKLIKKWLNFDLVLRKKGFLYLFFITALYKSFSITYFMSGIYPEMIGMCLILASLYTLELKKYFLSGALFAMAVLCRQTEVFFAFLFLYSLYKKRVFNDFIKWIISGGLFTLLILYFCSILGGNLLFLLDNAVFYNLHSVGTLSHDLLGLFIGFSLIEFRIIVTILFTIAMTIYIVKNQKEKRGLFLVFLLSSLLGTFFQASFFSHHFSQFIPFAIVLFALSVKYNLKIRLFFIVITGFALFVNYYTYSLSNIGSLEGKMAKNILMELPYKKYIQVVPFYPELYIYLNKNSPDRNFHSIFLSKQWVSDAEKYRQGHELISKEILRETTFVFVVNGNRDEECVLEYKSYFQEKFKLKKIEQINIGSYNIELDNSEI